MTKFSAAIGIADLISPRILGFIECEVCAQKSIFHALIVNGN